MEDGVEGGVEDGVEGGVEDGVEGGVEEGVEGGVEEGWREVWRREHTEMLQRASNKQQSV